jgi:hypothetical protein
MLKSASDEQKAILAHVARGRSVKVDAVAGSGKTTTCLHVAKSNPTKAVFQLTYNARLKLETRARASQLSIHNIEVHSYHAFFVKYFDESGFTDVSIIEHLKRGPPKLRVPLHCDILIIDEAQDMNLLYFQLVLLLLQFLSETPPQLIVMGDCKQSIFNFNGADHRFLSLADKIFKREMEEARLSTSYRLTTQTAAFINECCVGAPQMHAVRDGRKPQYVIDNVFGEEIARRIFEYLTDPRFSAGDIFVLCASVRSDAGPAKILANRLTQMGVPIFVSISEEDPMDEDILAGKVVFSTFHQSKGLERSVVFLLGFDAGYFQYYKKNEGNVGVINNEMYVALTRAKQELILVHHCGNDFLPFVNRNLLSKYTSFEDSSLPIASRFAQKNGAKRKFGVKELLGHINPEVTADLLSDIEQKECTKGEKTHIEFPTKVWDKEMAEAVADINGVSIVAYYEFKATKEITFVERLYDADEPMKKRVYGNLDKELLRCSTEWLCVGTGYKFKRYQIKSFAWIETGMFEAARRRLEKEIGSSVSEIAFEKECRYIWRGTEISGCADIYDAKNQHLWEIKVVNELKVEHFIQLLLYRWLFEKNGIPVKRCFLFNVRDGRKVEVSARGQVDRIVETLIQQKRMNKACETRDCVFLEKCWAKYIQVC